MERIERLLESNRRWAEELNAHEPGFFERLGESQNPDFLWIGCSDSRISPTSSIGLLPGEMFVHRNVANLVSHSDMNCLAVMQFAVDVLKVEHIIVCGHYGCGGVKVAFDHARYGLVNNRLRHIQDTMHKYEPELEKLSDNDLRQDRLCELNVIEQVISVGETTIVQDAWAREQTLYIHGWIYRIAEGVYRDMEITVQSLDELDAMRNRTYKQGAEIRPLGSVSHSQGRK